MANKIQTGAGSIVLLNGQMWGIVTGLQYQLSSPRAEDRGLDSLEAFELGVTTTSVAGSISVLMLREDEGLEGRNITAGLPYISEEQYFTLEIQDRASGFSILKIEFCSLESQGYQFQPKNLVQGTFSFKGIQGRTHFTQKDRKSVV